MDALILGSSGLIGGELLKLLLKDSTIQKVKIIVRQELPVVHEKLEQILADYSTIEAQKNLLMADVVFSCLGTTKKKTPDKREYYEIDHDYPVLVARLALKNGASSFHLVSSLGANHLSSSFYLKMKGETERDIIALGYDSIHIYQPSLLKGERKEKRGLEGISNSIMQVINPLLLGSLKKYRNISGKTVASAMHKQALLKNKGTHIYTSDKIKEIA